MGKFGVLKRLEYKDKDYIKSWDMNYVRSQDKFVLCFN